VYEIRQLHEELKLAGHPKDGLLSVSADLLCYVLSLLRNEQPILPQAAEEGWFDLLKHLRYHGIIPLLYLRARTLSAALRPPEIVASRIREIFLLSCARWLRIEKQLREILDTFRREKISLLVLKGQALACTVYPDPATRPSVDIDLLIRPDQYFKARNVLNQLGYRSELDRFETFHELFNAEPFVHKDNAKKYFEVDVHWSLFQYHGLNRNNGIREVFRNPITVETPALRFETLDRVNALIYAAFHLILHHPKDMRLTWIGDIALLAESLVYPDEWEVLRQRCSTLKLRLAMKEALKLAQVWYGLQIPGGYNDFTKWLDPEEDEKAELTYLLKKEGPDIRLKGYFGNFLSAPRKIQFLLKFLFPSPDYICMTYPPPRKWLLPLSYVRRWGSWIAKVLQYVVHEVKKLEQFKS
jgi:hypothetical protein